MVTVSLGGAALSHTSRVDRSIQDFVWSADSRAIYCTAEQNASMPIWTLSIFEVAGGSTAQSLGFQRGDLVVSVNNEKIARTSDLDRVTKQPSRLWRITILRGGQQISVVFGG